MGNTILETKLNESARAFFYEQAGYSFDPAKETAEEGRAKCAAALADAEAWARKAGTFYNWMPDPDSADNWSCTMYQYTEDPATDPKRLGSLCQIDLGAESPLDYRPGHRAKYARVIEAELALEAMP